MRPRILLLCLMMVAPAMAYTQTKSRPNGYVFLAPGGVEGESTLHLGGGGVVPFYKGLGAEAEIGYLAPSHSFSDGFGVFSANGSYEFSMNPSPKVVPFATAGYSLGFRCGCGTSNGFNFGGGIYYWIGDRMGLRVEFRDHVFEPSDPAHFYAFQIGWAFR